MLNALYYPHTEIQDPVVLKNALLLWDSIETIVPGDGRDWQSRDRDDDPLLGEANEIVVRRRIPTSKEQSEAHQTIEQMFNTGFIHSLIARTPQGLNMDRYLIYPEKFLNRTWAMLERGGMAHWVAAEYDYGVPAVVGFLMMSVLAESIAGTQVQKVTDRVDAYAWIAQQRAQALESQYVTGLDVSQVAPAMDRLVTLSLEVLDAREIPLKKLVALRKKEAKQGGHSYATLRHNYLKALESHIERVGKEAKTERDYAELSEQFKAQVRKDLGELKDELGANAWKTLFSKEVALSALIVAGSLTNPIAGLTTLSTQIGGIGVIPLLKSMVDYREARRKALQGHFMSWLFLNTTGRISTY